MATNGDPKLQKVVILSDYSDGEGKENDRSCKFNGSESSSRDKNEGNADQKENYVYRTLAEDYKIVADLTGYPHLAAMLAFEKEWKENRKKKNKKRKKKKKQKIEIEPENETKPEKMAANGDPKLQQVVILSDDSDNEGQKNGRSSKIDGTESSNHKKNEGNADQKENYVYRTLAEDYKIVADLTGYPHLAAMLAFEAKWKENRKKKNNKRKKKKQKIELEAQNEMVNEVGKEEERARNDVPHMLPADTAEEESQLNTSKAIETTIAFRADDDVRSVMLINLGSSSSERDEAIVDLGSPKSPGEGTIVGKDGKRIVAEQDNLYAWREGKQPETVEAVETTKELETESVPETESILPEKLLVKFREGKKQADSSKDAERRIYLETESTERACNIGLQKFLHGPRYFDLPKSGCFNCGKNDHTAVNCIMQKRKKPCFVCEKLDHNAKHCKQSNHCFICHTSGHLAKDCTKKHQTNKENSKICSRCGDSGHNMFSCTNDYSPGDLKKIQCYICKTFGHLCCADVVDEGPRKVSCYNCGQSGHMGSGCTKQHGVAGGSQSSFLCYKCGGEGHFARECTKDFKIARSMSDFATPKRFPEKKKYILGFKSAPHDKACKRNMKYRKTMNMNQGQSGWNDRWDTVQPRNLSGGEVRANVWSPPASFDKNRQEIFTFTSYGQFASLQHPGGIFNRYTKPQSSQAAFTSYGQYTSPLHPRGVFNNYIEPRNSQAAFMSHGQYTSPLYPQGIFSHYTEPQSSQAYTSHLQHQGFGGH